MFDERAANAAGDFESRQFLTLALGLRFEMRFPSEPKWWPASILEVAEALRPYHPCAEACLRRMLDGEEVCSRLAMYRIARLR
jgi:hypothetical protein